MYSFENPPNKPAILERALISYARRFPVSRGKLRLIDAVWPLAASGGSPLRTASLIYGDFKAPCDLRDMLQRQIYFFGTYYLEREFLACWSRLAKSARTIFDVGANAGIYSLAALASNPNADVHAFEPTPEIAARLRDTVQINRLRSLNVHQSAVTERPGEVNLVRYRGDNNDNDGMNYIRTDQAPGPERVVGESLDVFCSRLEIDEIDLIKIDIQGAEASALRGAKELLKRRRIKILFIELNWGPVENQCPASQAIDILEEHGYHFAMPTLNPQWRSAGTWMRPLSDVLVKPISNSFPPLRMDKA